MAEHGLAVRRPRAGCRLHLGGKVVCCVVLTIGVNEPIRNFSVRGGCRIRHFAGRGEIGERLVRFVSLATKDFEPVWWQEVTRMEWDWTLQGEGIADGVVSLLEDRANRLECLISPRYITGETFPEAST